MTFWGEVAGTVSREIFFENPAIMLGFPGSPATTYVSNSDAVALALRSVLSRRVREVTVTSGRLIISFETGLTVSVDPDQRYESWQITSADGLLIVCRPDGDLAIWYAQRS